MTGEQYLSVSNKRILGTQDFKDYLLDYLRDKDEDVLGTVYASTGVFGAIEISAAGNDKFDLDTDVEATDGQGHKFKLDAALAQDIQFENANAIAYHIGLKYNVRPKGIQTNPRTGWPEYMNWQESVGEKAEPDAVTDFGSGVIKLVIDSVCESGVSHAGRKCVVWLVTPAKDGITETKAIEERDVQWDGSNNYILTSGDSLGQDAISTTASDYQVMLLGPTVRRNTDLSVATGYAYIGTVTGVGAGSPPSSFDISEQNEINGDLSGLGHIVRTATNGRLKVEVKAIAGEANEHQIRVKDSAGTTMFWVDEDGDVFIKGDLTVEGETTQQNVVEVQSSHIITDNLTAGDADTDQHSIQGDLELLGGGGTVFSVDGTTGNVGIGGAPDPVYSLTCGRRFAPNLDNTHDLGDASRRWKTLYVVNIEFTGDFLPINDDAQDLGSATKRWAELWLSQELKMSGTVTGSLIPTTTASYDLGSSTNKWFNLFYVGRHYNDILPGATESQDIGSSSYKWRNFYMSGRHMNSLLAGSASYDLGDATYPWRHLYISGSVYGTLKPDVDEARALGGSSQKWGEAHIKDLYVYNGVAADFTPSGDNAIDLGGSSTRWKDFYIAGGVYGDLLPAATTTYDLGASDKVWSEVHAQNLTTHGATTIGGHVVPTTNLTYNLGDTLYRFDNVYADQFGHSYYWADRANLHWIYTRQVRGYDPDGADESLLVSAGSGEPIYFTQHTTYRWMLEAATGDFAPFTGEAVNIGTSTKRVNKVYCRRLDPGTGNSLWFDINGAEAWVIDSTKYLLPRGSYGLGNSSYRIRSVTASDGEFSANTGRAMDLYGASAVYAPLSLNWLMSTPSNAKTGDLFVNSAGTLKIYNGSAWVSVGAQT